MANGYKTLINLRKWTVNMLGHQSASRSTPFTRCSNKQQRAQIVSI